MIRLTEQTVFAERYIFNRLLGHGGFSEVWLATDKITGLEIAVKVYAPGQGMDTDGMHDFCKELSQVYNLNHTNLLKPQHVDNWEGMPYLVMPFCKKGSCHRLIGTMSEKQIWKLLHDVASGLAYLHEQDIIHQDIKPDNILIDNAGNYVITDFGISVQSRSTLRKSMNISSGSGTTAYMGPERFSTDPTPIKASDIWSLGATAYELLTGNAPFGEIGGGMQKGGADLPTIKQNISSELRMVLTKMMSLNPWDRPTAETIEQWAENPKQIFVPQQPQQPISQPYSQPYTNPYPAPKGNKKGLIIGIVVAALVLILGGGAYMVHEKRADDDKKKIEQDIANATKERIELQHKLREKCTKYISDLTYDNFLENFDKTVIELREFEEFEKKGREVHDTPIVLKKSYSQENMKLFRSRLSILRNISQSTLDRYNKERYDKNGNLYQRAVKTIACIDEASREIDMSEEKSAFDIKIYSDNF